MQPLGDLLLDVCQQARKDVLLVAPFIKLSTLQRILDVIADDVTVQCVTRWRPDEIAAGVSDIEIWPVIRDRPNSSLWLRADLHAKYYRADQRTLIGSANLTNAALSWSSYPNLELLVELHAFGTFESILIAGSVVVDDDLYMYTKQLVDLFPQGEVSELELSARMGDNVSNEDAMTSSPQTWVPLLRHPEKLYIAYLGNLEGLGLASRQAALADLGTFELPRELTRGQFIAYIGLQLLQKPIVNQIDKFLETPRRFGAVRAYLEKLPCRKVEGFNPEIAWQGLMRWMLYFLPDRYSYDRMPYSEIISRKN